MTIYRLSMQLTEFGKFLGLLMLLLLMQVRILRSLQLFKLGMWLENRVMLLIWMTNRGHSTSNLSYWFDSFNVAFSMIIRKNSFEWHFSWEPP